MKTPGTVLYLLYCSAKSGRNLGVNASGMRGSESCFVLQDIDICCAVLYI